MTRIQLFAGLATVALLSSSIVAQNAGEVAADLAAAKELSAFSGRPIFAVAGSST